MCGTNQTCKCKCPKKEQDSGKGGCCKPFKKAKENKPTAPQNPPAPTTPPVTPPQP